MSLVLRDVFLENSAITPVVRLPHPASATTLMDNTIAAALEALGDSRDVDVVGVTTQTGFNFYDALIREIGDKLKKAGVNAPPPIVERSFSNSQPFMGNLARRAERESLRVLMIALEPLNLYPPEDRVRRIRSGVLDRPERHDIPSMMHGLSDLIEAFCLRFGISPEAFAELKAQLTLALHTHKARNPEAQYPIPLSADSYANGKPVTRLLNMWDCCPATSQGVALVLAEQSRMATPKNAVRLNAQVNYHDRRPRWERHRMQHYPKNEALFSAANALFNHPVLQAAGFCRERLFETGILELHNAVTPLVVLLLIEMGFITPDDAARLFEIIDFNRLNPTGGLLAGHPLAATAPVLMHHCRLQLLERAPESLQLPNTDHAVVQSIGGLRDAMSLTLLSRV